MIYEYMIPVYAYLIKTNIRTIESLPEQYRLPVADYMSKEIEIH